MKVFAKTNCLLIQSKIFSYFNFIIEILKFSLKNSSQFICDFGGIIENSKRCDQEYNCVDRSDETDLCKNFPSFHFFYFYLYNS